MLCSPEATFLAGVDEYPEIVAARINWTRGRLPELASTIGTMLLTAISSLELTCAVPKNYGGGWGLTVTYIIMVFSIQVQGSAMGISYAQERFRSVSRS